jgi:hypothetical protein
MRIIVTSEDIDKVVRRSTCSCPVARAVRRATNATSVSVGSRIWYDGKVSDTPPVASDFIEKFDNLMTVEPIEFEIFPRPF